MGFGYSDYTPIKMRKGEGKKARFHPKIFMLSVVIAALVSFGLTKIININFLVAFGIVIFSMLINGWIADKEDNFPGGFNNPTPEQRGKRRRKG